MGIEIKKPTGGHLTELPISVIRIAGDRNPRQTFAQNALFDLGRSMEQLSQIQPVIVNRSADGEFTLVVGERRVRAAVASGLKFIEAKVYDELDPVTGLLMAVAENNKRKDLNVIEEGRGMRMLRESGFSDDDIAYHFGCSEDTVRKRLSLLELPEDVQRLMVRDSHPLPIHQALALKGLPESDQLAIARKAAPLGGPVASEEQVRQMVAESVGGELQFPDKGAGVKAGGGGPATSTMHRPEPRIVNPPRHEPQRLAPNAMIRQAESLKPVAGAVALTGKVGIGESGLVEVRGGNVTIRLAGQIIQTRLEAIDMDLDAETLKKVVAALKKEAAAAAKAKSAKTAKRGKKKAAEPAQDSGGECGTEAGADEAGEGDED